MTSFSPVKMCGLLLVVRSWPLLRGIENRVLRVTYYVIVVLRRAYLSQIHSHLQGLSSNRWRGS
jgi:hypothetical protein